MDIKRAAEMTKQKIPMATTLPDVDPEYGTDHLVEMCDRISAGEITGEKAHRWLGWVQACICMGGGATLEELKKINQQCVIERLKSIGLGDVYLPVADCQNCEYSKLPNDGGYCYMFETPPGEKCGQFKKAT